MRAGGAADGSGERARIGFIGLGNMGMPMASNLQRAGFDLVVHNRTAARAERLVAGGAELARSPADVARRCDVVHACIAGIDATRRVHLGDEGVLAGVRPGQVVVEHGTVDIATSRALHDAAASRGASALDAPVSGGPAGAADASLSIMVGGDREAYAKALPSLEAMGRTIVHLGGPGAGTAAKLVNQLLVGVHTLASCEALALAGAAGVDLERLVPLLEASWGASRMLARNAPVIRAGDFAQSAVPLRNLLKDLGIVGALGAELGLDLAAARTAKEVFSLLARTGGGEWDITAATLLVEGRWSTDGPRDRAEDR